MNHILQVENVCKNFGTHTALRNVSLEIPEHCIYGLLGPNGAGKTTLIRIINQITYPDTGNVFFDGKPLAPEHIAQIGYLPEERGLYKNMKVGEQALYLAQLKGLSKTDAKQKLKYWFERFQIGEWWNKKVQELSKGMAQKVQFIVTVLHEPKLLIFDEPFSGFDPINANLIKDEILALKDQGTSIIFSTHRMESVEEICEYIALLNSAEKVLDGKLSDIKNSFKSNSFRVGLKVKGNEKQLVEKLKQRFEVSELDYVETERQLYFKLKLANADTSVFINQLNGETTMNSLEEIIPSANDIFIQTVNSKVNA